MAKSKKMSNCSLMWRYRRYSHISAFHRLYISIKIIHGMLKIKAHLLFPAFSSTAFLPSEVRRLHYSFSIVCEQLGFWLEAVMERLGGIR